LTLPNLVGLGVDGCSTMLGEKKGLAKRMKETSPSLVSFHCLAHRIHNLQNAYAFYNKSAKRQHRLRELMEMSHNQKSMEDIAIETLEHAVKESLKEGILFYQDYNLLIYRRRRIEKDSSFEIEKVEYNPLARTTIMFRSNM